MSAFRKSVHFGVFCYGVAIACALVGASAQTSSEEPYFAVDGLAVGGRVHPDSAAYHAYSCEPSEQYAGSFWCESEHWEGEVQVWRTILHSSDGIVLYVNKKVSPVLLNVSMISKEIIRLSMQFNMAPKVYEAPNRPGLPKAIIATWGDIWLQPLEQRDLDLLAEEVSPQAGILVDFLGDFTQSARAGVPIYRLSGIGSGYVWIASFDEKTGEGKLRFFAADPQRMERGVPYHGRHHSHRYVVTSDYVPSRLFIPCQAAAGAEPHPLESFFPWPPPKGSDNDLDFTDFVRNRLRQTTSNRISLGDVHDFLRQELRRVGRSSFAYFTTKNQKGFVFTIRIEEIDDNGYLLKVLQNAPESANFLWHWTSEFFTKLVTLPKGRFRLLVFFVSNDFDLEGQQSEVATPELADAWLANGCQSLPSEIGKLPFSNHKVKMRVYEFLGKGARPTLTREISMPQHLVAIGLTDWHWK